MASDKLLISSTRNGRIQQHRYTRRVLLTTVHAVDAMIKGQAISWLKGEMIKV